MAGIRTRKPLGWACLGALLCALGAGCFAVAPRKGGVDLPHELSLVSLPPYVVESPDILLIDAVRLVPKPPYRIEPLDALALRVEGTKPMQPILGVYPVESDGTINLGFSYGTVRVAGMTVEEARAAVENHLKSILEPPITVSVALAETRAMQQVRGPHLVRMDGTVSLGVYGSVYVDNMTIPQAKAAIEAHLAQFLVNPEISLDVQGFNSKVYYVITDGGGLGEQVYRLPMTGKTTVLDAMAQIGGLPVVASKHHIWLARPAPSCNGGELKLDVDWPAITRCGDTATNYQVLPGDRLYVKANPLVTINTFLDRLYTPIERTFGVILLGTSTVRTLQAGTNTGGVLVTPATTTGVVTTGTR